MKGMPGNEETSGHMVVGDLQPRPVATEMEQGGGWWMVVRRRVQPPFVPLHPGGRSACDTWIQPADPRGPHSGSRHPLTPPPGSTQSHVLRGDSADPQLRDMVKTGRFSSHSC